MMIDILEEELVLLKKRGNDLRLEQNNYLYKMDSCKKDSDEYKWYLAIVNSITKSILKNDLRIEELLDYLKNKKRI